jgi:hypothetical protein
VRVGPGPRSGKKLRSLTAQYPLCFRSKRIAFQTPLMIAMGHNRADLISAEPEPMSVVPPKATVNSGC